MSLTRTVVEMDNITNLLLQSHAMLSFWIWRKRKRKNQKKYVQKHTYLPKPQEISVFLNSGRMKWENHWWVVPCLWRTPLALTETWHKLCKFHFAFLLGKRFKSMQATTLLINEPFRHTNQYRLEGNNKVKPFSFQEAASMMELRKMPIFSHTINWWDQTGKMFASAKQAHCDSSNQVVPLSWGFLPHQTEGQSTTDPCGCSCAVILIRHLLIFKGNHSW